MVLVNKLEPNLFVRQDETPDENFYRQPRFVTHIDEGAIAAVTELYREFLPPGGAILDLMSSWVSHLPPEVTYGKVVGLGLNEQELATNPRFESYVVHNLNTDPVLPFENEMFDGATIAVSIDYLTQPVKVLCDLGRVLVEDAPIVITFSNRCFPSKAVAVWHRLSDQGRLALVAAYLKAAGNWLEITLHDRSPDGQKHDPLFAVTARRIRNEA